MASRNAWSRAGSPTSSQAMTASMVSLKAIRAVQRRATGSWMSAASRRSLVSIALALKSSA